MNPNLRAAGHMAFYCILAFLLNASKIPHETINVTLAMIVAAVALAYSYPRECFPWLN